MIEPTQGLRMAKRRRTFEEILASGVALFREQGIRRTRTEQIAKAAAVSSATLFNYFPSKSALADAWVRGELDQRVEEGARAIEARGLRPVLRGICRTLADCAADAPALRLEAWRASGRARERALDPAHPLVKGLAAEQLRERIRQDVPAPILAEMLLDALEAGLIDGLRAGANGEARMQMLQARVDLILDGARKRNERVELARSPG